MSQRIEDEKDNVVKIIDSEGKFSGTGSILEVKGDRHYITCHHCICRLDEIYLENGNTNNMLCPVEWIAGLSDMSKDIALLKMTDGNELKSKKHALVEMAQLSCFRVGLFIYST